MTIYFLFVILTLKFDSIVISRCNMKKSYCVGIRLALIFFCNLIWISSAISSVHNTAFTKSKPSTRIESNFTNNTYQLASVNFIVSQNTKQEVEFTSPDILYCLATGYNLISCPDGSNPAEICLYNPNYFKSCCDPAYKYNADECVYPLSASLDTCANKYKCVCDRILFPIGNDNPCPFPQIHNDSSCLDGKTYYYAGCTCPVNYDQICDISQKQVGKGEGCSFNGETKYTACECAEGYNSLCERIGPNNPSDYCLLNGIKYYNVCKTYEKGETIDFNYTGTVQSVTLPAGQYKLQVWGAQGGGSGAKGGYSEGIITLDDIETLYVFVGGQGTSTQGGWNGGGGSTGYSSYNSGGTNGYSYPYAGGGATDISLITANVVYAGNRTTREEASLNSRLIVAGGGAGASTAYQSYATASYRLKRQIPLSSLISSINSGPIGSGIQTWYAHEVSGFVPSIGYKYSLTGLSDAAYLHYFVVYHDTVSQSTYVANSFVMPSYSSIPAAEVRTSNPVSGISHFNGTYINEYEPYNSSGSNSYSCSKAQQGGGLSGLGNYPGTQTSAGSNGGFGFGANQAITNYRYASGAGGGGWYGGGSAYSDSSTSYVNYSGGGSGFIYTSSATTPSTYSVPSKYQLNSASSKAGNVSFPSPNGGNETGHSGNGFARITAL